MNIQTAQKDMRSAYLGGSTGAIASGIIWLITGVLANSITQQSSILFFFFGGMFIFPFSILISKLFKRSGQHSRENPLGKLALESTLLLFIGLFIAYVTFQINPSWFFPIMLMIIGGRYLIFQSIYGMPLYWIFGFVLIGAGVTCLLLNSSFQLSAILGGVIELIIAGLLFVSVRRME